MRKLMLLIFVGLCQIHSGGIACAKLPTKDDSALSVAFEGESAKQVFDQIGPDVKRVCDDAKGYRERREKSTFCTYTPRLENPDDSHYQCRIGINLRTGEDNVRASCQPFIPQFEAAQTARGLPRA